MLSSVSERDTQLAVVQLVQTSPAFREWLISRFVPDATQDEFLGVSHSVTDYYGETDVEVRFRTEDGSRHFILIECKIDASFHDDQIDRYYRRGDKYREDGICDGVTVGLIAPGAYVSESLREPFDSVVTFEEMHAELDTITHDSVPFCQTVFDLAVAKEERSGEPKADLLQQIKSRVQSQLQSDLDVEYNDPGTRLKVWSNHPAHPDSVRYDIRVDFETTGKLKCGIGVYNAPDIKERVYDVVSENFESLDVNTATTEMFEKRSPSQRVPSQGIVETHIQVPPEPSEVEPEQMDEAASTLVELIHHYHPRIVEEFHGTD